MHALLEKAGVIDDPRGHFFPGAQRLDEEEAFGRGQAAVFGNSGTDRQLPGSAELARSKQRQQRVRHAGCTCRRLGERCGADAPIRHDNVGVRVGCSYVLKNTAPQTMFVPSAISLEIRCRETAYLELHHLDPHARGGLPSAANLTLRCKAHNALAAEHDFGRDFMQAKWADEVARARSPG